MYEMPVVYAKVFNMWNSVQRESHCDNISCPSNPQVATISVLPSLPYPQQSIKYHCIGGVRTSSQRQSWATKARNGGTSAKRETASPWSDLEYFTSRKLCSNCRPQPVVRQCFQKRRNIGLKGCPGLGFMDAFSEFRATLVEGFQKESSKFEHALKKELQQRALDPSKSNLFITDLNVMLIDANAIRVGDQTNTLELNKLRDELNSLRQYPAKIQYLEQENAALRSRLERAAGRRSNTPKASIASSANAATSISEDWEENEESNRQRVDNLIRSLIRENELQDRLKEKELAYKILMEKHLRIIKKFRELNERAKSWQLYHDRIAAKSEREISTERSNSKVRIDEGLNDVRTSAPLQSMPSTSTDSLSPSSLFEVNVEDAGLPGLISVPSASKLAIKSYGQASRHNQPPCGDKVIMHLHEDPNRASDTFDHSTQPLSSPVTTRTQLAVMAASAPASIVRDESASPILISERSLKRKRPTKAESMVSRGRKDEQTFAGSRGEVINVKSEAGSSPGLYSNYRQLDLPHDSIDLDEIGARSFTPRKKKRTSVYLSAPTGVSSHSCNNMTSDERDEESLRKTEALYAGMTVEYGSNLWDKHFQRNSRQIEEQGDTGRQGFPYTTGDQQSRLARQQRHNQEIIRRYQRSAQTDSDVRTAQDPSVNKIDRDAPTEDRGKTVSESAYNKSKSSNAHMVDILQPKTPNVLILPRIEYLATSKHQIRRRRDNGSARVSSVAEDGECYPTQMDCPIDTMFPKKAATPDERQRSSTAKEVHSRLGDLLAEPSPEKPLLAAASLAAPVYISTNNAQHNRKENHTGEDLIEKRMAKFDEKINIRPSAIAPEQASSSKASIASPRSSDSNLLLSNQKSLSKKQPLRDRPIDQLTLDDFRVNSLVNGGFNYAFNEVIRKRDQRKCLPNCTKPECCGDKFHKLVKIGGFPFPQQPGLWDDAPTDEADEDCRVLRDHFGLATNFINNLTQKEKKQLLLRARAERVANEYGKHRKLRERPPTPPGFWRTEMPTTQEEEGDKAAAIDIERRKVEERYIEAKKNDGLWKFRDE